MRFNAICVLGLIAVLVSPALADEMVDNPAYQSWAKFKPGTEITYSNETSAAGMNMNMDMTHKLMDLSAEKATVETTIQSPMTGTQKQTMTHPAKVEKDKAQTQGKVPEGMKASATPLGKETLTIDGKSYECEVTKFSGEQQGMSMEGKSWTCEKIPGTLAKMEMAGKGEQTFTTKMTLKKLDSK